MRLSTVAREGNRSPHFAALLKSRWRLSTRWQVYPLDRRSGPSSREEG